MTWLQIRRYLLMAVMFSILYAVIAAIGAHRGVGGTLFYIIMAVIVMGVQYLVGPALVGWTMKVKWVAEQEEPELHHMVAELAREARIKKPKVGISQLSIPNAFAYGSFDSRVVVTRGILDILNKDELKAVLGHEISHIRHRDIIIITTLSVIPLVLYYIARGLIDSDDDDKGVVLIGIAALIAYYITNLLVLYASRIREYYADQGSVRLGNKPSELASALYKLVYNDSRYKDNEELKQVKGVKAFFVNDPTMAWEEIRELNELDNNRSGAVDEGEFRNLRQKKVRLGFSQKFLEIFSTHPNMLKRMKHLSSLIV